MDEKELNHKERAEKVLWSLIDQKNRGQLGDQYSSIEALAAHIEQQHGIPLNITVGVAAFFHWNEVYSSGLVECANDGEDDDLVDVIASGYEWICPECDGDPIHEIEHTEVVRCPTCHKVFRTNPPEHAIG